MAKLSTMKQEKRKLSLEQIESNRDGNYLRLPKGADPRLSEALSHYYQQGPGRTFQAVAKDMDISAGTISQWNQVYDFPERVRLQNEYLQQVMIESREDSIRKGCQMLSDHFPKLVKTAINGALHGGLENSQQKMLQNLISIGGLTAVEKLHVKHEDVSEKEVLSILGISNKPQEPVDLIEVDNEDLESNEDYEFEQPWENNRGWESDE